MNLKKIALVTGLAVSGITVSSVFASANAADFTVDGNVYDITTVNDPTYAQLDTSANWGNNTLSYDMALVVATSLGTPNTVDQNFNGYYPAGPYFTDSGDGTIDSNLHVFYYNTLYNSVYQTGPGIGEWPSTGDTFAIATLVTSVPPSPTTTPEPSSILGLGTLAGFGLIGGLKRKLSKK